MSFDVQIALIPLQSTFPPNPKPSIHRQMAITLHSNFTPSFSPTTTTTATTPSRRISTVRSGPRDNRGPLLKGRILSIEAIQAIQALKRSYRTNPNNLSTHNLSRLIKSDLIAAFNELLRQDQCVLALKVFSTVRSEFSINLSMCADLVAALARSGLTDEIDSLIGELESEGMVLRDEGKGLIKLVKALIDADRRESTVSIYRMMKRSNWGKEEFEVDEYLARVLRDGLRKFGEEELAEEVEGEIERLYKGIFGKSRV